MFIFILKLSVLIILASLSLFLSGFLIQGDFFYKALSTTNFIAYLLVQAGNGIWIATVWQLSPFIIQILIETFKTSCKKVTNLEMHGILIVEKYKSLVQGLQNFLFVYFTIAQSYLILYIFFTFSSSIKKTVLSNNDISMMMGSALNIASISYILISLTSSVEDSFDCMETLKENAQDLLSKSQDKPGRKKLKYLIQKIENLKGMSARGYFTVDKSTLTSMVSVR